MFPVFPYQVLDMTKRWLLFLGLYLACLSAISFGIDCKVVAAPTAKAISQEVLGVVQVGLGDCLPDEARVTRGVASTLPRQRAEGQPYSLEDFGLTFLSCKLIRSYSEIHLEHHAIQLMGRTIQVNAP